MRCVAAWVYAVAMAASLCGQRRPGTITGAVTDPDGGLVPTAPLEARSVTTGLAYKATSVLNGRYSLSQLPAGTYDIAVSPIGFTFSKFEQKGIAIQDGQTVRLSTSAWHGVGTWAHPETTSQSGFAARAGPPDQHHEHGKANLIFPAYGLATRRRWRTLSYCRGLRQLPKNGGPMVASEIPRNPDPPAITILPDGRALSHTDSNCHGDPLGRKRTGYSAGVP